MIASLSGVLSLRFDQHILIEVNGVGYRVLVSSDVLAKSKIGEKIKVFTYTHVREDALDLFGFLQYEDLKLFQQLISVSGVGPKTALSIFSFGTRNDIVDAIVRADTSFFTSIPRLGKKNAQKIIIDLKGKLGSFAELDLSSVEESSDVITALQNFGFSQKEAHSAVKATRGNGITTAEKVKLALKYLGK